MTEEDLDEEMRQLLLSRDAQRYGRYFDRNSRQITFWEWAALNESDERVTYKRVAYTDITEDCKVFVSTVWLGLDHNWSMIGPPLIFETMVFGPIQLDQEDWRWHSEAEALAGHNAVVALVRLELDAQS